MEDSSYVESRRAGRAMAGGITRGQLRGPGFERRSRGLYRPAGTDMAAATERVADAAGLLTSGCFLGGWAALHAQGNSWFDGRSSKDNLRPVLVHCQPGSQLRQRRDQLIQPFRGLLHPDETLVLEGFSVTTLARAAFDEMRMAASVREAVVVLDMATSTTSEVPHTTIAAIRRVVAAHHKVRGLVRAREALALGSPRSASPWETRLRLVAELDAGLADVRVNAPVFGPAGRLIAVVDLLDEDSGLVIESDGGHHREIEQHAADNMREELLERAGLVVVRFTSGDHADRWSIVRRINAALQDARRSTRHEWTIELPGWWSARAGSSRWH